MAWVGVPKNAFLKTERLFMNKLIKINLFLIMGLSLNSCLYSMENPVNAPITIENAHSSEDFQQWLKQEEQKVWQKLEMVYGINQNQCQELKKENKAKYDALEKEMILWEHLQRVYGFDALALENLKNNHRKAYEILIEAMEQKGEDKEELSEGYKNLVKTVLKDFGLESNALRIVPFVKRAPASSTDTVLNVNPLCLPPAMPENVKKYLVALAVAMALSKDHSTDFELARLRQLQAIQDSEALREAMAEYERLKVVRADMRTMLLGSEYRSAQNIYVQRLKNQPNADDTDRARYIIGQYMTNALS